MLAPAVAVLSDRIPLNKRGTLSAFYGGGATAGQSIGTIIGTQFLSNPVPGFIIGTVSWLLTGILAVIIWPREKSAALDEGEQSEKLNLKSLLLMFVPPTKNCRDFYLALFGRLLLIFGYFCINGYQLYILEKYIGLPVAEAGRRPLLHVRRDHGRVACRLAYLGRYLRQDRPPQAHHPRRNDHDVHRHRSALAA